MIADYRPQFKYPSITPHTCIFRIKNPSEYRVKCFSSKKKTFNVQIIHKVQRISGNLESVKDLNISKNLQNM